MKNNRLEQIKIIDSIRDLKYSPSFYVTPKQKKFNADKLLKLVEKHAEKKGPNDLSSKHDKYLYGE